MACPRDDIDPRLARRILLEVDRATLIELSETCKVYKAITKKSDFWRERLATEFDLESNDPLLDKGQNYKKNWLRRSDIFKVPIYMQLYDSRDEYFSGQEEQEIELTPQELKELFDYLVIERGYPLDTIDQCDDCLGLDLYVWNMTGVTERTRDEILNDIDLAEPTPIHKELYSRVFVVLGHPE
jgi:hypothetical protein